MGWYESVIEEERVQVRKIVVNPDWKLLLLKHRHYAEHGVMVARSAEVQVGEN